MTTRGNSFEGIGNGVTVTAANSGGVSGDAFDSVTIPAGCTVISDNTHAAHGGQACKQQIGGTALGCAVNWLLTAAGTVYYRAYLYVPAFPSATIRVVNVRSGASFAAAMALTATGKLQMQASTGGQMAITTASVPTGAWFRVEGFFIASATAGQGEVKLFTSMDSTSPAETKTSAATFNTLANFDQTQIGIASNVATTGPWWLDDLAVSTAGYVGPFVTGGGGGGGTAGKTGAFLKLINFNALTGQSATFDGGNGNWTPAGNSSIANSAVSPHNGSGAMRLTSLGPSAGLMDAASCTAANITTQGKPCTAGDTISCSAWLKAVTVARNCQVGAAFYTAAGVLCTGTNPVMVAGGATNSTSAYTLVQGQVTTPSGVSAAFCRLHVRVNATAGTGEQHDVDDAQLGPSTLAQAITQWTALSARGLDVRREYFAAGQYGTGAFAITADLTADAAAGRKVCLTLRPPYNPVSATDRTNMATFLASCAAAGLVMDIALWHEPFYSGLSAAQYIAMVQYYGPTIQAAGYPVVFCTANSAIKNNAENTYYPGDAYIDKVATDYYAQGYVSGDTLDDAASIADAASPRKPFGVWELNASTDTGSGQTTLQGTNYFNYLRLFFNARLVAGKTNADLLIFNADSNAGQETPITMPGDYRIALWQAQYDAGAVTVGAGGAVGAYLNPSKFGAGTTLAQAITDWQSVTSRPLDARRVYFTPLQIPAAITTDLLADQAAGRKVCMSLRPDFGPPTTSAAAALDTFLSSCKAAGLVADVALYHEPNQGMSMAQFIEAFQFYAPTIKQYYPRVFCTSSYFVQHGGGNAWYPGDAFVDKIATDIYASEYDGGIRLDLPASLADAATPPKPFGIWEFNSSTDAAQGQTQAQSATFFTYLKQFFQGRLASGKPNCDLLLFNSDSNLSQETPIITAGDYRVGEYQDLYDGLTTPPVGSQTRPLAVAVTLTVTVSAGLAGGIPIGPPPPPPVLPPAAQVLTVADWSFVIGPRQPAGGHALALTEARNRTAVFRCDPGTSHEASFDIDGRSVQASGFAELISDLQVIRNGQILAALRIVPTADQLDAMQHVVSVTARDYREVLRRRLVLPGDALTWNGPDVVVNSGDFSGGGGGGAGPPFTDQAVIAWQIIQGVQARNGGDLGIVPGAGQATGHGPDYAIGVGDFAGDAIDALAQTANGFDWDITAYGPADLRLDIWSPYRGFDRGVILEHGGGLVARTGRTVDPSAFANAWLVTGSQASGTSNTGFIGSGGGGGGGSAPPPNWIVVSEPGLPADPAGRWDQVDGTSLATFPAVSARAYRDLANGLAVIPSYVIELYPGKWGGPGHIWLGDAVTVRVMSGRLRVNDKLRVSEIAVTIGEEGQEQVTLTVGRAPLGPHRLIARMLRRIQHLELR